MERRLEELWRDLVYATRTLTRSASPSGPSFTGLTFTGAAILTLALGIGAAASIASLVHTILLRPLPFPDGDRLVEIVEPDRPRTLPRPHYGEYQEWRSRTRTLSALAVMQLNPQLNIRTRLGTTRFTGSFVSANYFEMLGVRAVLGRTLEPADEGRAEVAVLSDESWRKFFEADPAVIGTSVETRPAGGGAPRRVAIVGVLPAGLETFGTPFDLYQPFAPATNGKPPGVGRLIGRLREGVSLADAAAEANLLGAAIRPPRGADAPPLTRARFEARGLKDSLVAPLRPALRIFLAAVIVVLLIVCANVANLLLARGTARRREMAVRRALGASRARLMRQVLAECLVLAVAGGLCGALLAGAGVSLVKRLAMLDAEGVFRIVFGSTLLPRASEVGVDGRLFLLVFGITLIATVLFGLLPALHLSNASPLQAMGARGGGAAARDTRLRGLLVVAQMAMATVLLVSAGLLASSFINLTRVAKGYDPAGVLAFQLVLPEEYPTARKADVVGATLAGVRALPGVTHAGFAYAGILVGIENTVGTFVPPGATREAMAAEAHPPRLRSISPGYLEAVGTRLIDGRLLTDEDSSAAIPPIIVNRATARRYFGEGSPVGVQLDWYSSRTKPPIRVEIVGVVEDIRQFLLDRPPYAEIFMDYRQVIATQQRWQESRGTVDALAFGFQSFALRTTDEPRAAIAAVRRTVARADANAGLDAIMPLERLVANSMARERFYAVMLGLFALVAALLAAIGIYGVLAYAVAQRTQEMGVRLALGARRGQLLALVLRRGLWLAAWGITIGLAGAAIGTSYLRSLLFGLTPLDGGTFALVAVGFTLLAMLASYLPARRATRVDPMVALRSD